MSELDSLIEELFPEKKEGSKQASPAVPSLSRRRSEWDEDSEGVLSPRRDAAAVPASRHSLSSSSAFRLAAAKHGIPTGAAPGHAFDDDSDEDGGPKRKASAAIGASQLTSPGSAHGIRSPKAVLFPVPFPSLGDSEGGFVCSSRCFLTNVGAPLTSGTGHPSLQQLRAIAADERGCVGGSRIQAMLRKGAFHAAIAKLGNGCLDHHGDYSNEGGCSQILCRHCNYMVVRLQDAEWDDAGGSVNLYLTLRNFYPDWSRLASSTPVGIEGVAEASNYVLRARPAVAAYCCQCSWVTVRSAKALIETRLTDIAMSSKSAKEGQHPFATELPLLPGEARRPPVWVCHGHPR